MLSGILNEKTAVNINFHLTGSKATKDPQNVHL
jgi:hypothetical protein